MTEHGISSATVGLALAVLSAAVGCTDLHDGGPEALEELSSMDGGAADVPAQVPVDGGQLSDENVVIESVKATGTGCPDGSFVAKITPEGDAVEVKFEKYQITAPPVTSSTSIKSLTCNASLRVRAPKNRSYAVTSYQYRGYANLAPGMKASLIANYAFTGFGVAPSFKELNHQFVVPFDSTFVVIDRPEVRGESLIWSPCDISSSLQIRTRLTLEQSSTDRTGVLAMDSLAVPSEAGMKLHFKTSPCPRAKGAADDAEQ